MDNNNIELGGENLASTNFWTKLDSKGREREGDTSNHR
jgi:hypothetical protein